MKIVIQCAGRKNPGAGSFFLPDGKRVLFVAHPETAPHCKESAYAKPDDPSENGESWRDRLLSYNRQDAERNPLKLLPAYMLYANSTYRRLVERFGVKQVFILSAGWGLIAAGFLTPAYDITFSPSADPFNRRKKGDKYLDLCMIEDDGEDMAFLGGKDYLPLFYNLTRGLRGEKTVFYNSELRPDRSSKIKTVRFKTTTRTNWHYECANALIEGRVNI